MIFKNLKILFNCSLCICINSYAQPVTTKLVISENALSNSFQLFGSAATPEFYYDAKDAKVVQIAAAAFANDIQLISGKQLKINKSGTISSEYAIVAGTIGKSAIIDELIREKLIEVSDIKDKWECFTIHVVKDNSRLKEIRSTKGVKELLVITGSDRRGTAFGIFHLSRAMGVSPFVWWADVVPAKRRQLFVSGLYISIPPSVQYRVCLFLIAYLK